MKALELCLDKQAYQELEAVFRHHEKPYMRLRALALLHIAKGRSANDVALNVVFKDPDTVRSWLHAYREAGIVGLVQKAGRDENRRFFPLTPQVARQRIEETLRRSPFSLGYAYARWLLKILRQHLDWIAVRDEAALWRVLYRLGFRHKQGQAHVHSPDPSYDIKRAHIQACRIRASQRNERVLLYLDEVSVSIQPSTARVYAQRGEASPYAQQQPIGFPKFRIIGALNALTGQVTYNILTSIGAEEVAAFMTRIARHYPTANLIYVVLDNWSVHYHANVLARLRPQLWVHDHMRPRSWSSIPADRAPRDNLPIELLPLPTYASWLNPIEKLWRKLKQELAHMHPFAGDKLTFKQVLTQFLDQFKDGSSSLLHYVGLAS